MVYLYIRYYEIHVNYNLLLKVDQMYNQMENTIRLYMLQLLDRLLIKL